MKTGWSTKIKLDPYSGGEEVKLMTDDVIVPYPPVM